jgi:hypothetical protein
VTPDPLLDRIRDLIQEDVRRRGLRTDPAENLITATIPDFQNACRSIAEAPQPALGVVTGFMIPHAQPPSGETDGPLGALFLARALAPLGIRVVLATDPFCTAALEAGLEACGLTRSVPLVELPSSDRETGPGAMAYWQRFTEQAGPLTHLVALERAGPSHTPESVRSQPGTSPAQAEHFLQEVPPEHYDRCHTMRGLDITAYMRPAHLLFEACALGAAGKKGDCPPKTRGLSPFFPAAPGTPGVTTIGIGDGGNEIGMGKIPWDVIRRNVPGGGVVACRVPVEHLIVCGVSNWGAYGLAAGVRLLCGRASDPDLFGAGEEERLLRVMVEQGPLVDGMSGRPEVSVDGLAFERYAEPLRRLGELG